MAARTGLPPVAIVFGRVGLAAAGLAVWVALRRPPGPALFSIHRARLLLTGAVLALHWSAMFAGYASAPAGTVAFVVFLAPVGIAVAAPRALGEANGPRTLVALAGAIVGFVALAAPELEGPSALGVGWAAVAAVTFVAIVLLAKPLAQTYGGLRLTLMEMVVAGVLLAPLAATTRWGLTARGLGWLVVLGLVHTAVGTAIYLAVLARVPAAHVGIVGYLEPVGVVAFAALADHQGPPLSTVIGAGLIVTAGMLVIGSNHPVTPEVPGVVPR